MGKKKQRIEKLEQEVKQLKEELAKTLAMIPNVNITYPEPFNLPFWDNGIRYC